MDPKPKFNLTWYKNEDSYSEGDIEDTIIQMIKDNEPEQYTHAVFDNFNWSTYYHLTHLRKNIINWYPFRSDSHVLEIGCGMGAVTDVLCDRCERVTAVELSKRRATAARYRCRERDNLEIIVGNLNDIVFEEQFDYITLIGVLEYQGSYTNTENPYLDFLKKIRALLKPSGKLLIAIENQYGIKYWCGAREDHTNIPFDGMNQYSLSDNKVRTFSRAGLEHLVRESGFGHTYFYYPMPDYKVPTVIYSQDYLPQNGNMQNVRPYYIPDKGTLVAQEENIYQDIVENGVFEFFANSFLVECSDCEQIGEILFSSMSSERLPEYRIGTRITRTGLVEKFSLKGLDVKNHLLQTESNLKELKRRGLKTVATDMKSDMLISDFCTEKLLEDYILELYEMGKVEEILSIFDRIMEEVCQSSDEISWEENILYQFDLGVAKDEYAYGTILETGYLDMIPRNAFFIDNQIHWFDQEWSLYHVPVKFIMFRMITELYRAYPKIDKVLSLTDLAEHYELLEIWDILKKLEGLFAGSVMDAEHMAEANTFRDSDRNRCIQNIQKLIE